MSDPADGGSLCAVWHSRLEHGIDAGSGTGL